MESEQPKRRTGIRWSFVVTLFLILFIYGMLCYYVGVRGYGYLRLLFPGLGPWAFWPSYWLVAGAFFIGFGLKEYLPRPLFKVVSQVGDYWLAALTYLTLVLPLTDLLLLLIPDARPLLGAVTACLLTVLLVYGVKNARDPRVVRYRLDIPARGSRGGGLRVVLVSDLHLGSQVGPDRLKRMVDMINQIDPELVLVAGDIIEKDFDTMPPAVVAEAWRRLSPRWGTYAVMGNHDYYSGMVEQLIDELREVGVTVLRDEAARVDDLVSLVGRDEREAYRNGRSRKPLSELIAGVDPGLPVILLDHQPVRLPEAEALGVDLMLSGHTHRGQMFPFNLVTRRVFEVDWGYLRRGGLQVVVSCGYGTWGPPIRIGNRPEVVELDLKFVQGG